MALESQREQWWTGAALCHRSLEFWPQRLRRKVRGRGLSPPTCRPGSTMWGEQGSALDGCTGAPCQDSRLRHIPAATELWNPPPATNVCARSEWCGPHLCTSSYFCRSRPPLTHLQCHPSPSGSYHPRCHPPHLLVGPPHHSRLQISGLPRGNRGTECGRPVYSGGPAHVRHLCLMCATCCALSSLWDH